MILSCYKICKSFGTDQILKDVSFHIEEHEKAAIVGINGAGKSTLMKIIASEMEADSGELTISRGKSLGYLAQQNMLSTGRSIYDEVAIVKKDLIDMEKSLREMEAKMDTLSGAGLDELMEQYEKIQARFDLEGGYAWRSEIAGVLKGLGFSDEEFSKNVDTLSGGQKTRVALGKLLLMAPDIMLLDEPINHLDLNSIEWLENYLLNYRGSVLVIAHDRYFLNRIVTKVIELDNAKAMTFQGNYSAYAEKKKQLRETQMKAWLNQQAQIRHQEEVIEKLRSFNREKSIKRAESREKMLGKMEILEKPSQIRDDMRLTLTPRVESGMDVLSAEHLSKGFEYPLFNDLSIDIRRGERVALIGNNGTGKSTLLKILIGKMEADEGSVKLGTKVQIGYYDQEHQILHPDKTLFEELSDAYPDMDNTSIRNVLAAFLFTGDDAFKQVKELSGGERGRLSLARLMLSESNFLILDEPTNHLDIVSKEILEDALCNYTGSVLCVSHDRYFINRIATRILDLTGRTLVSYLGNYDYYLEKHEELTKTFAPGDESEKSSSGGTIKSTNVSHLAMQHDKAAGAGEEWKRRKEEQARARKKASMLEKTEEEIALLEEKDAEIDIKLQQEEIYTDLSQVTELSEEKSRIHARLEELYAQWEELAE